MVVITGRYREFSHSGIPLMKMNGSYPAFIVMDTVIARTFSEILLLILLFIAE
jgi:hypothetical protein